MRSEGLAVRGGRHHHLFQTNRQTDRPTDGERWTETDRQTDRRGRPLTCSDGSPSCHVHSKGYLHISDIVHQLGEGLHVFQCDPILWCDGGRENRRKRGRKGEGRWRGGRGGREREEEREEGREEEGMGEKE